jgi:predicted flap endonuclease-1-like 5' DNA nuclease
MLTQTSQASSEHRNLLAGISENLSELVPDIDAISKRKTRVIKAPQRLTDIKGIGPVYAGLLHEAGIETFTQLASLTPDELLNLIDVPSWRRINAEEWIDQASLFASQADKVEKNR